MSRNVTKDLSASRMLSSKELDLVYKQQLPTPGLGSRLLKGVQSFYVNSRACGRVGDSRSNWFLVKGVMLPRLFNVNIDGAVREVNEDC